MSNFQAYFTYLYNGHASPLNISTNYHGYHDLCGSLSAVPDKIATLMMDHFERPKLRFYLIKLYRNELQSILSKSGTNPELRVSESGLLTASKHLLERAANYERIEVKETVLKERIRKEVIQF